MPAPTVSQPVSPADLASVHRDMCITVPLDQLSPLMLATLTVVARCCLQKRANHAAAHGNQQPAAAHPLRAPGALASIDLKRRAAGDID